MKVINPILNPDDSLTLTFVPDPTTEEPAMLGLAYEEIKHETNEQAAADIEKVAVVLGFTLPKVG